MCVCVCVCVCVCLCVYVCVSLCLSAGVDGVGGGDDLVVGWELRGLDSLLGSLDERIMARYS